LRRRGEVWERRGGGLLIRQRVALLTDSMYVYVRDDDDGIIAIEFGGKRSWRFV